MYHTCERYNEQICSLFAYTFLTKWVTKQAKEEQREKKILRSPNVGQASDLYWASRAGDIDAVRQILANTNFNDLNHLEPNGSTALHASSFFGHADVVRILLQERSVMRHRKNRHGLTAYEEAANDEIRQLFHRPNSTRFCSDLIVDGKDIFNFTTNELPEDDENDDAPNDNWVDGINDDLTIRAEATTLQLFKILCSASSIRSILRKVVTSNSDTVLYTEKEAVDLLQN